MSPKESNRGTLQYSGERGLERRNGAENFKENNLLNTHESPGKWKPNARGKGRPHGFAEAIGSISVPLTNMLGRRKVQRWRICRQTELSLVLTRRHLPPRPPLMFDVIGCQCAAF